MLSRRSLMKMGYALAASSILKHGSFAQSSGMAKAASSRDPMAFVNPEFRPILKKMLDAEMGDQGQLSASNLAQRREEMRKFILLSPPLPSPAVTEYVIPGQPGAPKVRVIVVGNSPGASKPAVLHLHGGGYVMGSPDTDKLAMQRLSIDHDCVVVSVDYRLAPETRFPDSLEDNYTALRWLHTNAKELGVDVTRLAVKGESAGGGHAAALAIAARDRAEFPICLQVLIYPMLDDRTGSSRKMPDFMGKFIWTAEDNKFGWTSLLGVPAGSSKVPLKAVPARLKNLAGLPPAFIGVGSIDLFAPEDIAYADSLVEAGVSTELHVVPGAFHGFDLLAGDAPLSKQFSAAWNSALKRAFVKI
jgi:acetyl esterase/lipase